MEIASVESANRFKLAAIVLIGFGSVAVVISMAVYWFVLGRGLSLSHSPEDWATFGTYFTGVAGTIVAFGTLVAVALTFHLQARELAESRALLSSQAATLSMQAHTAERQAFDSNFYQLLRRFSDHVGSLFVPDHRGRDAVNVFLQRMQHFFATIQRERPQQDAMVAGYRMFYKEREADLGVYFRLLYHVFKLIDRSTALTDQEKIDYANLARAQLSAPELCLLFYNCAAGEGAVGFKPYVEKYGLLKHLNIEKLVDPSRKDDRTLFSPQAFMDAKSRAALSASSGGVNGG